MCEKLYGIIEFSNASLSESDGGITLRLIDPNPNADSPK